MGELAADARGVDRDLPGGEIPHQLFHHVLVAGALEVRLDHFPRIGVRRGAVEPWRLGSQRPSSLLRRAFALKASSWSRSNFFSKPFSRSWKLVIPIPPMQKRARTWRLAVTIWWLSAILRVRRCAP